MTENTPFADRPWAGRFLRPTCEYEAYIVFVMRRSADGDIWRVELPVVLRRGNLSAVDQPDKWQEVTFGIPYDALEFVESDEEVCKVKFK